MFVEYKYSPELFEWNGQFEYNPEEYSHFDNLDNELREFYRLYELVKKTGEEDLKGLLHAQYQEIFFATKNLMVDDLLSKEVREGMNDYLGGLYNDRF